jgi:Tol biopolymer transport system component
MAALLAIAAVAADAAVRTRVVSVTAAGAPGNGVSRSADATGVSRSGRFVAFESLADNLPGGDGVIRQVYVRDLRRGKTRLISKDGDGDALMSPSFIGGISANGRFVAFVSAGSGLPASNGFEQVWVHDRRSGRTRLASKAAGGAGDSGSGDPSLSADGSRVSFQSDAANFPGATGDTQVYVRDLERKRTILASKSPSGEPAQGFVYNQSISSDGRRVAFTSSDPDLPGGNDDDAYVRDLRRQRTILAGRANDGDVFPRSYNTSISGNGRFVVFETDADQPEVDNQIYVRDLQRRRTRLAGRNSAGEPQTGYAEFAHLSQDGRYLQFSSDADNLPGGNGTTTFTYIRDMRQGKTRLASRVTGGGPPDAEASFGSISLDGRWVVFESEAGNLSVETTVRQVYRAGPFH